MKYQEKLREAWRLQLLKLLNSLPSYKAGQYFLYECMTSGEIPPPSADQVETELHWLSDQGYVELSAVANMQEAKITQRGIDIAEGRAIVPGVARVRP